MDEQINNFVDAPKEPLNNNTLKIILTILGIFLVVGIGILAFIFLNNPEPVGKCGDGICDEFEKQNPQVCPGDCEPSSTRICMNNCVRGNVSLKHIRFCKDECGIKPIKPNCPEGSVFNFTQKKCVFTPESLATCPEGYVYNEDTNKCEWTPDLIIICPEEYDYNEGTEMCEYVYLIEEKTCSELGGDICLSSESCSGSLLNASDSDGCCGGECQTLTSDYEDSPFGINEGLDYGHLIFKGAIDDKIKEYIENNALLLEELNLGLIRLNKYPFRWGEIEATQNNFNWDLPDYIVQKSQENNFGFVGNIRIDDRWATGYVPNDWQHYKSFVKKVVERYDGDGVDDMPGLTNPIKYWEIENEPSLKLDGNWLIQPEKYFELLKNGYNSIKEADNEAKVLIAGYDHIGCAEPEHLEQVFELGADSYFDIMNIHIYPPTDYVGIVANYITCYQDKMREYGISKPLWITETATCSELTESNFCKVKASEKMQAQSVITISVSAFSLSVDKIFWHTLRDGPNILGTGIGGYTFSSLVEYNDNPRTDDIKKPAFYTYKLMIDKLDYFDSVETIERGMYKFSFSDKNPVYVLWSDTDKTVDLSQYIYSSNVKVTHIIELQGQTEPETETMFTTAIPVSESPMFIEAN